MILVINMDSKLNNHDKLKEKYVGLEVFSEGINLIRVVCLVNCSFRRLQ